MSLLSWLSSALFPSRCLLCRREGPWLCETHDQFQPAPPDQTQAKHLDKIHAAVKYYDKSAEKIVEYFKFHGFADLADLMTSEMVEMLDLSVYQDFTLVPIPLHWSRRWWRGFNQAEKLAEQLSLKLDLPIFKCLKRRKRTSQQARLGRVERMENMKSAFVFEGEAIPKQVLLVDDVVASGATLDEAARVLKAVGVSQVEAMVFARGGKTNNPSPSGGG